MILKDYKEEMSLLGYKLEENEIFYKLKRRKDLDINIITISKEIKGIYSVLLQGFDRKDLDAINFTKAFAHTEIEERKDAVKIA